MQSSEVSVNDAVKSYLFNTQLLSESNGNMILIAPTECQENSQVADYLKILTQNENSPIKKIHFMDVKQSMKNGGGPACLRLRVVLNENEKLAINSKVLMTDELYKQLNHWVNQNYRDKLCVDDFRDLSFLNEVRTALDELTQILNLGSVYDFQTDAGNEK